MRGLSIIKELDSGGPLQFRGVGIAYHRGIIGIDGLTEAVN